jgi:Cft2 family RNA processing exonuclease/predicted  nucleic acid-binding Zn-ribbon protein
MTNEPPGDVRSDAPDRFAQSSVAILDFLLEGALPEGPLTEESVPRGVLDPLLEGLIHGVAASKRSDPLPGPLKPFANWRGAALKGNHPMGVLWQVLWGFRDHEFVQGVLNTWLEMNQELAEECKAGSIFIPDNLRELLSQPDPVASISELASTLWALGLDEPSTQKLFRYLVAIHKLFSSPPESTPLLEPSNVTRPQPDANKDELKRLRKMISESKARESEFTRELASRGKEVERMRLDLQTERRRSGDFEKASRETQQDLERMKRRLKDEQSARDASDRRHRASEAKTDRLERTVAELNKDLVALQEGLKRATEREAQVIKEFSRSRRALEYLEGQLADLTSSSTVLALIRAELEQAKNDRQRLQGGPHREAAARAGRLKDLERQYLEIYPELKTPRPAPALVRKTPVRFLGLGGCNEVGASAYLLEIGDRRILVDCGIRVRETDPNRLGPDITEVDRLDAVVLTHAHADHVGWLPALVRRAGNFDIYTTPETQRLAPLMLQDCRSQLERTMASRQLLRRHGGRSQTADPSPYERADVEEVERRLLPLNWGEEIGLRGGIRVSLHRAGHLLGASSALIEVEDRKVLVSGDIATFPQRTVEALYWPSSVVEPDLLILEATYGDRKHEPRPTQERLLADRVSRVVSGGGIALIPCFALGRAQEILSILSEAMRAQVIPIFPVWIDGLIDKVNEIYRSLGRLDLQGDFREVRTQGWRPEEVIEQARREPCAIVATSGMMTGGPMIEYAEKLAGQRNTRLLFSGYLDEDSPGRRILGVAQSWRGPEEVIVQGQYGEERRIRIAVPPELISLSAHADQAGLMQTVREAGPRNIALVHAQADERTGRDPAKTLARRLRGDGFAVASDPCRFELT